MNKKFIVMAASALLLTGCAKDAFVDGTESQPTSELQEIRLSVSSPATLNLVTRAHGSGSVGDIEGTDGNVWNGQQVNVFAILKNASELTLGTSADPKPSVLLGGTGLTAGLQSNALTGAKEVAMTFGQKYYYPAQGAYNFFGYYADTAETEGFTVTGTTLSADFTFDGSQDIMIAKAELSYDDKCNLIKAYINPTAPETVTVTEYIYDADDAEAGFKKGDLKETEQKAALQAEFEKAFSAYTARRSVQPNLVFQHQLSRFVFKVKAGNLNATLKDLPEGSEEDPQDHKIGVYVTSVELQKYIKEESDAVPATNQLLDKGTITVTPQNIAFALSTEPSATSFKLTDKGQSTLTPTGSIKNDEGDIQAVKIGESLLVAPNVNAYFAEIKVQEYYDKEGNPLTGSEATYGNVKIKLAQGNFLPGASYDITITVYSKEEIEIKATLTGWIDGGGISVDPESDEFEI